MRRSEKKATKKNAQETKEMRAQKITRDKKKPIACTNLSRADGGICDCHGNGADNNFASCFNHFPTSIHISH